MRELLALSKPRIALLVALTTAFGWAVAGGRLGLPFLGLMLGVTLASGACGALNQWVERSEDALMKRTKTRPLPAGRLSPSAALSFGLLLAIAGPAIVLSVNGPLAAGLTALTIALYVFAYTPLKKVTPQTTWVGAAAGAMPPLIGWAAAAGSLDARAWALFGIQFLWQIPHFLALFWLYRDEYAAAGFKVMPVVHPDGGTTAIQIAIHSFTLVPATLLPVYLGMAGQSYGLPALAVSAAFLGLGMKASWTMARADARNLFLASLAYLPLIFGMLLFGGA
jgi:protoheme IX farnesyltransferase